MESIPSRRRSSSSAMVGCAAVDVRPKAPLEDALRLCN